MDEQNNGFPCQKTRSRNKIKIRISKKIALALEEQLKRVNEKLQHLLKQHASLQKDNALLRNELDNERNQANQQQAIIENLRQQVGILKISTGSWEEKDKKEFEKKINSYIKEIDRCIALLSE